MANDHYTPVKPASNAQGQTADADDVNAVSNAVETAFDTLEAEIDALSTDLDAQVDLAQEWAEQDEDVNITGQPAGSYSAKHYSAKAAASAASIEGDVVDAAASAAASAASAVDAAASASDASGFADDAATSADEAEAAAASLVTSFTPNNQSGNYTLVSTDKDAKMIRMTGDSAYSLTVPPDVFTTNVFIPVIQTNASGTITIAAGSGVTLNTPAGKSLVIYGAGYGVTLYCVDPDNNTWDVVGQLLDA